MTSLADWSAAVRARVEHALDRLLPPAEAAPASLHAAMRHATMDGGKRIRPLLVHAAGELGAPAASGQALELAACAVELVHAYSLVHDDLPCMDDDTLRRGKPTVWVAYGEAGAMLAGDALQALAFEALARIADLPGVRASAVTAMVRELSIAAGAQGMVGGQAIDLESVGRALSPEALQDMHRRKTGALLRASVLMGARCCASVDAGTLSRLDRCGAAIGLAFQVIDDVLDVEADTATLGKTAGKDEQHAKPTYVSVLGLAPARALALRLRDDAHAAIEPLGAPARRLHELADLIVSRRS